MAVNRTWTRPDRWLKLQPITDDDADPSTNELAFGLQTGQLLMKHSGKTVTVDFDSNEQLMTGTAVTDITGPLETRVAALEDTPRGPIALHGFVIDNNTNLTPTANICNNHASAVFQYQTPVGGSFTITSGNVSLRLPQAVVALHVSGVFGSFDKYHRVSLYNSTAASEVMYSHPMHSAFDDHSEYFHTVFYLDNRAGNGTDYFIVKYTNSTAGSGVTLSKGLIWVEYLG